MERVNQQKLERFEQKLRDELKEHGWLEQEGQEEHLKQNPRNKELVWLKVAVAFICVWGIFLRYILARLFLWIEVFRTLCFLPSGAFVDTWSGSFPHIGWWEILLVFVGDDTKYRYLLNQNKSYSDDLDTA
jgi:hypothetical protein